MPGAALRKLAADGPHEGAGLYAPLIGSWEIRSTWYEPDGRRRQGHGEWHFEWVLGGLGVQDTLFAKDAPPHERGTSLRAYDAPAGTWRVAWMQPYSGEFVVLTGRAEGDGSIVQEGMPLDAPADRRSRWRFIDITPSTFTWLGEASTDGGRSWRLEQRMDATRMSESERGA